MSVKLEGFDKPYRPKDDDVVECHEHGVKTTWGALTPIQQLALEEGLDTVAEAPCIFLPERPNV